MKSYTIHIKESGQGNYWEGYVAYCSGKKTGMVPKPFFGISPKIVLEQVMEEMSGGSRTDHSKKQPGE